VVVGASSTCRPCRAGRETEAVAAFREAYTASPVPSWNQSLLAWGLAAAGESAEARSVLGELHVRERLEYRLFTDLSTSI
jgi:hypothetical protein